MFPKFQNDPNGLPAIIVEVADLQAGFDTGFEAAGSGDTAGYAVVAAYDAEGVDIAVTLDTVDVLDGTTVVSSTIELNTVGDTTADPVTVKLQTPDTKDYNADSQDSQEVELAPAAGTPGETVAPTIPVDGDADASAEENIPAGITDPVNAVDEILHNGYATPGGDANDVVPTDLPPTATKPWN